MTETAKLPGAIYVWLVLSEEVQEQPGSWRIRKWDIEPFPEANFTLRPERGDGPSNGQLLRSALTEFCNAFNNRGETTSLKEWNDRMRAAYEHGILALGGYTAPKPQGDATGERQS